MHSGVETGWLCYTHHTVVGPNQLPLCQQDHFDNDYQIDGHGKWKREDAETWQTFDPLQGFPLQRYFWIYITVCETYPHTNSMYTEPFPISQGQDNDKCIKIPVSESVPLRAAVTHP